MRKVGAQGIDMIGASLFVTYAMWTCSLIGSAQGLSSRTTFTGGALGAIAVGTAVCVMALIAVDRSDAAWLVTVGAVGVVTAGLVLGDRWAWPIEGLVPVSWEEPQMVLATFGVPWIFLALVVKAGGRGTHGSARWSRRSELADRGFRVNGPGISVGWLGGSRTGGFLRYLGPSPVALIGGVGSLKTQLILDSVLGMTEECLFVLDTKDREIFKACSRKLVDEGYRVAVIDFDRFHWNPLMELRAGRMEVEDVAAVADALLEDAKAAGGNAGYFRDQALLVLQCLILHVLYSEEARDLGAVDALLAGVWEGKSVGFATVLERVRGYEHDCSGSFVYAWRDAAGELTLTHPTVFRLASALSAVAPEEMSGAVGTARRALRTVTDPCVRESLSGHGLSFSELVDGTAPSAIFVNVEFDRLERFSPLVRLAFSCAARAWARAVESVPRVKGEVPRNIYWILDEVAQLGAFTQLAQYMATHRALGGRFVIAFQSLSDLQRVWGGKEPLMGLCPVKRLTATGDVAVLKMVEEVVGPATVQDRRLSIPSGVKSGGGSSTVTAVKRSLIDKGEMASLDTRRIVLLVDGLPPTLLVNRGVFDTRRAHFLSAGPIGDHEVSKTELAVSCWSSALPSRDDVAWWEVTGCA